MQALQGNFDCETVALMGRACDEAWGQIRETTFFPTPVDTDVFLQKLAVRVMEAVSQGERDPNRLKAVAMGVSPSD